MSFLDILVLSDTHAETHMLDKLLEVELNHHSYDFVLIAGGTGTSWN